MRVRFASRHETPVEELKNLRQTGIVREYTNAFDALLTKVGQLPEDIMLGIYMGGLFPDIRARVRFMRPTSLDEAQQFAQLQEDVSCNRRRAHEGESRGKGQSDLVRGKWTKDLHM